MTLTPSTKTDFDVDSRLADYLITHMKKLLLIAILLMFSACGNRQDDGIIRLSFWQFWTSPDVKPTIERLIAEYETKHPNVKIDLVDLTWSDGHEKIVVAFSTGTAPDIVELGSDWIGEFARSGMLSDLTNFYDSNSLSLLMWEPAMQNSRCYAVPWLLGTRVLYCNQNLRRIAGIENASPPLTWSELLDDAGRIDASGDQYCGFGSNSAERHRLYKKFLPFLWSNGGSILSDDYTVCLLDRPEAVEALTFYVALCDAGCMDTQQGLDERFLAGEIGFIISGDWLLRRIAKATPDFEISAATIPVPDTSHESVSFAGGEYLAVSSNSEHAAQALDFISYMTSPDADLRFCRAVGTPTPANIAAAERIADDIDSLGRVFLRQISTAKTPPFHQKWVYIEEIIERAVEEAIYHKTDAETALISAAERINRLLKE